MAAASVINLGTILAFIVKFSGKIPQAMQLINALIALFSGEIEAGAPASGLEVVELSSEEAVMVEKITQAISAGGTQAVLDLSKLRQFAKWLTAVKDSPLGKLLIGLLGIPGF